MSGDSEPALIYNINEDVLLYIFTSNADMFSDREALHTTLITSQVCRQWRDLILRTTSLWARLIDMDQISRRKTHEWREEIVRRGGAAPLWIRTSSSGRILSGYRDSPHDKCILQFFFALISSNYHRIQKLVIFGQDSSFKVICSMLNHPAPQLEHCEVKFNTRAVTDYRSRLPRRLFPPFFANFAPMLRIFHISGLCLDQHASWMSNLHSFVLNNMYNVLDALTVLSELHSLQELKIQSISSLEITTSLPIVSLSKLKYLEHDGFSDTSAIAVLMDHIQLPASCSFSTTTRSFDRTKIAEEKLALCSIINRFTRHAECALKFHEFRTIDLECCRKNGITLSCRTTPSSLHSLEIEIILDKDSDASLLTTFLKKLTALDLTSITMLTFAVNHRLNSFFGPLLDRLSSVERMFTDLKTLSHLAHLQSKYLNKAVNKPIILFPSLKVIDVAIHLYPSQNIFFVNPVLAAFLLWRLQEGYPISTLDMTNDLSPSLDFPPNLDALSKVKGLKVLYRLSALQEIVEHTCGTDDVPEKNVDTV